MAARRDGFPLRTIGTFAAIVGVVLMAACGEIAGPPPGDDPDPGDDPKVTGVSIDGPAAFTMVQGDTHGLTAVVDAVAGASEAVTWSSEDDAIVSLAPADAHATTLSGEAVGGPVTVTVTSVFDPSRSDSVEVTVVDAGAVTLSITDADVVSGSRVRLTWDATGANGFDLYAVPDDVGDPPELVAGPLGSAVREYTLPIPASDRQTLRLVAHGDEVDVQDEATPTCVILRADDTDPYTGGGRTPDTAPLGSLRYLLATVPDGATLGFAADVTGVDLYGVDLASTQDASGVYNDAHLVLESDVTISGPVDPGGGPGATLRVVEAAFDGTDAFDGVERDITWRSRVIYVAEGVSVTLENLSIGGGTFIYKGAGIANAGTLVLDNVVLSNNRAWEMGGGLYNAGTATLTDVAIDDNLAATLADEVGVEYAIRGDPSLYVLNPMPEASGYGGGLWNQSGATATLTDSPFGANLAKISGGSVYNAGTLAMTRCDVTTSVADRTSFGAPDGYAAGGAIYTEGDLTYADGWMTTNEALWLGGALFVDPDGTATLTGVEITLNTADTGGGIRHEYWSSEDPDNLSMTDTTVESNTAISMDGPNISVEAIDPDPEGAVVTQGIPTRPGRPVPSDDPLRNR
jgi:hypothetical protein